jgi:hypothetical protein
MAAPRYLPSDSKLVELARTMTHAEIAEYVYKTTGVKVGRSTVSAALSRAGLTKRIRYSDALPWERIRVEHNGHYAAQMLRAGARIEAGQEVSQDLSDRYESWKARLDSEDAVVHYDPDTADGFFYVKRRKGIDKGMVRSPKVP